MKFNTQTSIKEFKSSGTGLTHWPVDQYLTEVGCQVMASGTCVAPTQNHTWSVYLYSVGDAENLSKDNNKCLAETMMD